MKKSAILAASIAALMASSAFADQSWYGRANLAVSTKGDGAAAANEEMSIQSDASRVGWKGTSGPISAHFEFGYDGDGDADPVVSNRLGYVAYKADFGEIAIGKAFSPTWSQIHLRTLFFNAFSNDRGFPMTIWPEGVRYTNTFGKVKVGAMLTAGTDGEDLDGHNIAATFPIGPVSLAIGANSDGTNDDTAFSVQYTTGKMTLTATIKNLEAETAGEDETVTLLGFKMGVGENGTLMIRHSTWDEADLSGATFGYHHKVGPKSSIYLESSPADFKDQTHIGMRIDF